MKTTDFRATNLRATDLMIGDWVKLSKGNWSKNRQVGLTDIEMIAESVYLAEPIPLTPEILEKNGWKDISTHTLKGCETYKLTYEQNSFDYTITVKLRGYFKLQSYDDGYYTLCEMDYGVKYVHELQHALKLCGIEKEITL